MNVIDLQFADRQGNAVQAWAVLFNGRLFDLTFIIAPHWIARRVEFPVRRAA
jgi:hypothetical protein